MNSPPRPSRAMLAGSGTTVAETIEPEPPSLMTLKFTPSTAAAPPAVNLLICSARNAAGVSDLKWIEASVLVKSTVVMLMGFPPPRSSIEASPPRETVISAR